MLNQSTAEEVRRAPFLSACMPMPFVSLTACCSCLPAITRSHNSDFFGLYHLTASSVQATGARQTCTSHEEPWHTRLASPLAAVSLLNEGFMACRKGSPQGGQRLRARQCFLPSVPTGTWMLFAWEDFSKQLFLVKVKEQTRPGSIFSSNRSHNARSVMLDPIFCPQGNNIYPLIRWPNRFGLLGLSRDHAIHFTPKWNLKQSLKLQIQKIDLKKPTQLCEELVNLKLKL